MDARPFPRSIAVLCAALAQPTASAFSASVLPGSQLSQQDLGSPAPRCYVEGAIMTKDRRIEKAAIYTQTGHARKLEIREVASQMGISLKHFERLFKTQVGLSPKGYLRFVRVEKAKQLLRDSDMKVTTVALEVGYSDLRHFERDFKRVAGLLPKEYRNGKKLTECVPLPA